MVSLTLYLTRDLMEDSAVPSNLSVPKVPEPDRAATSARAKNKKGPKPGEHVHRSAWSGRASTLKSANWGPPLLCALNGLGVLNPCPQNKTWPQTKNRPKNKNRLGLSTERVKNKNHLGHKQDKSGEH